MALTRPRLPDLLIAVTVVFDDAAEDDASRMLNLGRRLQDPGRRGQPGFCEALCALRTGYAAAKIARAERELEHHASSPSFWADDLRAQIDALRRAATEDAFIEPSDVGSGRTGDDLVRFTQRLFLDFGRLLEIWPDVFAAATRLRGSGTPWREVA